MRSFTAVQIQTGPIKDWVSQPAFKVLSFILAVKVSVFVNTFIFNLFTHPNIPIRLWPDLFLEIWNRWDAVH